MAVRGTRRSGWSLLLGAGLAAVAVVSLLTFATLARRTSLGDAAGPRVAAIDPRSEPGQVVLPSPTPSGQFPIPTDEVTDVVAVAPPVDAPVFDPIAAPTATVARAARDDRARGGSAANGRGAKDHNQDHNKKSGPFRASETDGGGRSFASGDDASSKNGKGPKGKPADHPSNNVSKSKPSKPAKSSSKANGHGDSQGKGHTRGRGKGHDKHGD